MAWNINTENPNSGFKFFKRTENICIPYFQARYEGNLTACVLVWQSNIIYPESLVFLDSVLTFGAEGNNMGWLGFIGEISWRITFLALSSGSKMFLSDLELPAAYSRQSKNRKFTTADNNR